MREIWGIRLVFTALVLGLVWRLLNFPVWSIDHGLQMRGLIAFVAVPPLDFVLVRIGAVGAIIGAVGAYLIERGRPDLPPLLGFAWNRERLAIALAVGADAAYWLTFSKLLGLPVALIFYMLATNIVVLVGLGLYLFWTAQRFNGIFVKWLGLIALAFALVAAALEVIAFGRFFLMALYEDLPSFSVASALLGAGSLGIWILIYARILQRNRIVSLAVPQAADA